MLKVSTQCPAPRPFLWATVDHPYLFRVLFGFMFIPTQPSFPGPWVFFIKTNAALVHNSCGLQGFSASTRPQLPLGCFRSVQDAAAFIGLHSPTWSKRFLAVCSSPISEGSTKPPLHSPAAQCSPEGWSSPSPHRLGDIPFPKSVR